MCAVVSKSGSHRSLGREAVYAAASNMNKDTWDLRNAEALTQLENGDVPQPIAAALNLTFTNLWLKQFSDP